ncbi:hypothetical protein [Gynurincola endophyticus]|jgi:hypothetical protein|uniref:hypothetical protein n=1 Tax=Gynurincola endophyticus TaxID=2479004 RepID=UPI000F8E2417|nr:hypothetical protein [Gynurincola endophyticus]
MKSYLFIIAGLLPGLVSYSQEKQILKLLNEQLEKEIRFQQQDSVNYRGEHFEIVQPYTIHEGILSVAIKKRNLYDNSFFVEKQEVPLKLLNSVLKDINVLMEAEGKVVKITRTPEISKDVKDTVVHYTDLFFLHFCYEQQNEYLADALIKAFKKANLTIVKNGWYD